MQGVYIPKFCKLCSFLGCRTQTMDLRDEIWCGVDLLLDKMCNVSTLWNKSPSNRPLSSLNTDVSRAGNHAGNNNYIMSQKRPTFDLL